MMKRAPRWANLKTTAAGIMDFMKLWSRFLEYHSRNNTNTIRRKSFHAMISCYSKMLITSDSKRLSRPKLHMLYVNNKHDIYIYDHI